MSKNSARNYDIGEVLYEDEVKDLKDKDKGRRMGRMIGLIALQLGMLLLLYMFLTILGLFIGMMLVFFLFPPPFVAAPNRYKITTKGLYFNKGLVIFTKKLGISFKPKPEKNYVAIYRKNREMMWLYSHDVERLLKALEMAIQLGEERTEVQKKEDKGPTSS